MLSLLKKIGCEHLIGATDFCKGGVSQLNGGGYSSEVVGDATFISLKVPTQSTKTAKEEAKQWLNDASSTLNHRN